MSELQENFPPGWDCRLDEKSGKYYFVNHFTKTTTWDDPRNRHRPFQATPKHFASMPVEHIPLQEMRNVSRMSPKGLRVARVQDSSLTQLTISDTEEAVAKISAMFPTVSETHIKLLMKNCRYMKSCFPNADETLILEMLQSNENSIQKATEALKEAGYSKKDTVKVAQLKANEKKEEEKKIEEAKEKAKSPKPQIRTKSNEEKDEMKEKFKQKYKDLVADHLITIALESVDFDDKRANQILQIIIQEDNEKSKVTKDEDTIDVVESYSKSTELNSALTPDAGLPISQSRQSIKSLLKSERSEKERPLSTFNRMIEESDSYKSQNLLNTKGRNPDLSKGPNDKLLLEDYVKWQGPNPNNRKGSQSLAKGQNASLLTGRSYKACGPNADLRKGPKFGLAKGSIFSQMKAVLVGDVRGK